jgi:hypothetical protein
MGGRETGGCSVTADVAAERDRRWGFAWARGLAAARRCGAGLVSLFVSRLGLVSAFVPRGFAGLAGGVSRRGRCRRCGTEGADGGCSAGISAGGVGGACTGAAASGAPSCRRRWICAAFSRSVASRLAASGAVRGAARRSRSPESPDVVRRGARFVLSLCRLAALYRRRGPEDELPLDCAGGSGEPCPASAGASCRGFVMARAIYSHITTTYG